MSYDSKNTRETYDGFYINKEPSLKGGQSDKNDIGKYKCRRSTKHIRLNIIDNHVGQSSPEWTASTFDPLGSYTGITESKFEKPVQDADDL